MGAKYDLLDSCGVFEHVSNVIPGHASLEIGEQEDLAGVILEVIPNQLIVFTNAFLVGWIPQTPFMVGHFEFMTVKSGTLYKATSRHWDLETQQKHIDMGFNEGWTTVAKQLAALAEAY